MITLTNVAVGFYSLVLQNGFLQVDFFLLLFRVFIYLTPFELIFSLQYLLLFLYWYLLLLQYCSNLLFICSANVLVFQWKNLILLNFSFNWKVAAAVATTSSNHASLWELRYEVTGALNLRCNFNGSHQSEYLLQMISTTDFSQYPKTNYLSGKGLHNRRLYSKA